MDLKHWVITVRNAICGGLEDTPKSGHERAIPITAELRSFLGKQPEGEGSGDLFVCTKDDGSA